MKQENKELLLTKNKFKLAVTINEILNFRERQFFNFIIYIIIVMFSISQEWNSIKIILVAIITATILTIMNIIIDFAYGKSLEIENKFKKETLFKKLDKLFESVDDNFETTDVIDLIRIYMPEGYPEDYYNLIIEFKSDFNYTNSHKNYIHINKVLKMLMQNINFSFLSNYELHNVKELIQYIESKFKDEQKLYLQTEITILAKCLIDKNRKVNELENKKSETFVKKYKVAFFVIMGSPVLAVILEFVLGFFKKT